MATDFRRMPDGEDREAARSAAYRELYGSALGELVLRDMAAEVGLGLQSGPPNGVAGLRDYQAGSRDAVLGVAELAGVDVIGLVLHQAQNREAEGYYDGGSGYDEERE